MLFNERRTNMTLRVNLLPRKTIRERLWKTTNALVALSMLLNVSMTWVFLQPTMARAAETETPAVTTETPIDSAKTTVTPESALTPTPVCNLWIEKTISPTITNPIAPTDVITYKIEYRNIGTAFCTGGGVLLFDELAGNNLTYVPQSAAITLIENDQDLQNNDPAPELISGFTGAGSHKQLANLHEIGPNEHGILTLQAKPVTKTICSWTVKNTGWTDGDQAASDRQFQSSNVTVQNSAYCPNGKISGHKYDTNQDGLANWKICLKPSAHTDALAAETTTPTCVFTNQSGYYEFTGLTSGDYDVWETLQAGWEYVTPANGSYTHVAVQSPNTVVKDFVNRQMTGALTVNKMVDENGTGQYIGVTGTATPFRWGLAGDAIANDRYMGSSEGNLLPDDYTVTEKPVADYDFVGWFYNASPTNNVRYTCTNPQFTTQPIIAHVTADATTEITLCNQRRTGTITFEKKVLGGNESPSAWTFTIDGVQGTYHHGDSVTLPLGNYTVTESGPSGYASDSVSGVCSDLKGTSASLSVTAQGGTCTFVNARETGTIKVNKMVDTTGTGQYIADNGLANTLGFRWQANGGADTLMGASVSVPTGWTNITESDVTGYHMTGWFYGTDGSCSNRDESKTFSTTGISGISAWVNVNAETEITLCNQRDTGAIEGYKWNDLNGNGVWDANEPVISGITMQTSHGQSAITNTLGYYRIDNIPTGTESITEVLPVGWINTNHTLTVTGISITFNGVARVDFGNFQRTSIGGQKFNDLNNDGLKTAGEPGLANWTIQLYTFDAFRFAHPEIYGLNDGFIATVTTTTDVSGNFTFSDLGPGTYRIREINQAGWTQTSTNPADVSLVSGTPVAVQFGNHQDPPTIVKSPSLSITKSNTIVGFTNPGKTVTYTVVVTNAAAATDIAKNVILTDTLPNGFTFVDTGLATKTTSLGDLAIGQSKTLTYVVQINGFQPAGTYINTASAKGDNTTTVIATSTVEVRVPQVLGATSEPTLTIIKTVSPTTTTPGGIITYTITIKNIGDADATNVSIADSLPGGFTFVDTGTRTHTFNLGTIEPSHTRVIHYDVKVGSSVKAGVYKNVAVLTADDLEQQIVKAAVTIKAPAVLGLATTGPSVRDYLIFLAGMVLCAAGLTLTRTARHGRVLA